jgi:hypothetical protein
MHAFVGCTLKMADENLGMSFLYGSIHQKHQQENPQHLEDLFHHQSLEQSISRLRKKSF